MAKVVAELMVEGQHVFVRELDEAEEAVEGIGEESEKSGKKMSGMTSAMVALGGVLATRQLVQAGRDAANYAIELDAMGAKADTVFAEAVGDIRNFSAEHASRFGLAEDALTGLAAGYGDLLIPMGFSRDRAAEMTQETLELAGALGEWSPQLGGAQHALEALGAAMTGEREQLKQYGIVIDEAAIQAELMARGLENLTGEAERQAKAQVTLDLALRGSTDAQAQFAAGGNAAVVAQNAQKAASEEARAELGENLIPVLTTMNNLFADTVGIVSGLPEPVQTAGIALVGIGTASIPVLGAASNLRQMGVSAVGMRSALSSAATFMTGPWGLAIAGAAVGIGLLWNEQQQANDRIERANALIDTNTGALQANAAQTRATQLQQDGHADTAERFGISLSTVTAASMGSESAQRRMADAIGATAEEMRGELEHLQAGTVAYDAHLSAIERAENQGRSLIDTVREEADALADQTETTMAAIEAADELSTSLGTNTYVMGTAAAAHDSWIAAVTTQTSVTWGLSEAHHSSMGAAMAHYAQQERLAAQTQIATQSLQAQRDALRAAADPYFAASSAQQSLADAQERLESAETTEERAAAQDAVARAALDLQGALVDLDQAQGEGETSARQFGDALELLEDQGLINVGVLDQLIDRYDDLAEAAEGAARAMLGQSVQAGTGGYPDAGIRGVATGNPSFSSTTTATADLAPAGAFSSVQTGDIHLHGVDPSRPGEAQRLSEEMLRQLAVDLDRHVAGEQAR